jgi:hypothetical protein
MRVFFYKSKRKDKKLVAIFTDDNFNILKQINFGAKGYSDYTIHKDDERKKRYIKRHYKREEWYNPLSAGSLSRWILWNKKTLKESIDDYKRKFNFK